MTQAAQPQGDELDERMVADSILMALGALQGKYDLADVISALIQMAVKLDAEIVDIHDRALRMEKADRLLLSGPALILKGLDPKSRLRTVFELFDRVPLAKHEPFWMNRAGTDQILAFIDQDQSARFTHPLGLRPWLDLAFQRKHQKDETKGKSVHFDGAGSYLSFANTLRKFFKIESSTSPAVAALKQGHDATINFIFPPMRSKNTSKQKALGSNIHARTNADSAALQSAVEADDRRTCILAPASLLSRNVGSAANARDRLIYSRRISSVISIPSGVFGHHVKRDTDLLVITSAEDRPNNLRLLNAAAPEISSYGVRKQKTVRDGVIWARLLDVSAESQDLREYIKEVPYDTVIAGFSLAPARHLGSSEIVKLQKFNKRNSSMALREWVTFIRPRALKPSEFGSISIKEASIADICENGFLREPSKNIFIEDTLHSVAIKQELKPGDVVFSIKGRVGAVGIVPKDFGDEDSIWVAGQSLMIMRPVRMRQDAPVILYSYLTHPIVQDYISSLVTGTTSDTISQTDLENIQIPQPDHHETASLIESFNARLRQFAEIEQIRKSIDEDKLAAWPCIAEDPYIDEVYLRDDDFDF